MTDLSRRGFLKLGAAGAGLPAVSPLLSAGPAPRPVEQGAVFAHWDGSPLGRILLNVMTIYEEPSWRAKALGVYYWGDIVGVEYATIGEGLYHTNDVWLKTAEGFIYSSWVQPVNDYPLNPTQPIGEGGAWVQVTVPSTWARGGPSDDDWRQQRLYYSTVHRVTRTENDYYYAEEIYGARYWIKAAHCRVIAPEEVAPINPHVDPGAKLLHISVRDQRMYAYEGDAVVREMLVSTGMPETPTSFGEYSILDKRIGQRMTGGLGAGAYNLPGIPYVCYFTRSWIATHGCYWHNDYGRRHSNGCINIHPEDAKWVLRWTTPYVNYWSYSTTPDETNGGIGTRVTVGWE